MRGVPDFFFFAFWGSAFFGRQSVMFFFLVFSFTPRKHKIKYFIGAEATQTTYFDPDPKKSTQGIQAGMFPQASFFFSLAPRKNPCFGYLKIFCPFPELIRLFFNEKCSKTCPKKYKFSKVAGEKEHLVKGEVWQQTSPCMYYLEMLLPFLWLSQMFSDVGLK